MSVIEEIIKISSCGERVTHLFPNGCYFAHLSIYKFASQFTSGARVLDIGSGAGYGADYLCNTGAAFVEGIDSSQSAVEFSQRYFSRDNLSYRVADPQSVSGFSEHLFDVVFSSNTFEHIPDICSVLRTVWKLMKPEGLFILAVPPITDDCSKQVNVTNPYHLHIWSPRQWRHVLSMFFQDIQPYSHLFARSGPAPDYSAAPENTDFNENDFVFKKISIDDMYRIPCMTTVFVARSPFAENKIGAIDNELTFIDDSFSRSLQSALEERYFALVEENRKLRDELEKIDKNPFFRVLRKINR